jgi:arylsulfatase
MDFRARNLLLVSLDTLRADVAYGGKLKNLTSLCTRGISFKNAVSSAPLTPVSHASVFSGMQPYNHGIRHLFKERLDPSIPTLASLFSAKGYETGAIVSCAGMNRWYGLNKGFMYYDDEIPRLADGSDPLQTIDVKQRGSALKRAPEVVRRGLEWIKKIRNSPFFLFLHFFDTHWPYEPPEWFAPSGSNPYEGEACYVDHYLGLLLSELDNQKVLDETLIVIFSDHGEDLAGWYPNDHSGEELGHPEEQGHGCLLYDATQMVPLIFVGPGIGDKSPMVDTQVRLVDLLPTLVDLYSLDDACTRDGISLTNLFQSGGENRIAYFETFYRQEQGLSEFGIPGLNPWKGLRIDNRFKIVFDVYAGSLTAYDLNNDPNEMKPIKFSYS